MGHLILLYRHKIEIEEIIECALKELNLELQLNSVEEEWIEQVLVAPYALCVHVYVRVSVPISSIKTLLPHIHYTDAAI